jgi:hypothetical protein
MLDSDTERVETTAETTKVEPAKKKGGVNKITVTIVSVVAVLLLAGGAFWGGMSVGKAQAESDQNAFFASRGFDPGQFGQNGTGGNGGQGGFGNRNGAGGIGGRGANGTIQKIDGITITLQDNQGQTVTLTIGSDTNVVKTTLGSSTDLKVGDRITAIGDRSGNNVAARTIQVTDLPANMQGGIFGGPGGLRGNNGTPGPRATPTTGN